MIHTHIPKESQDRLWSLSFISTESCFSMPVSQVPIQSLCRVSDILVFRNCRHKSDTHSNMVAAYNFPWDAHSEAYQKADDVLCIPWDRHSCASISIFKPSVACANFCITSYWSLLCPTPPACYTSESDRRQVHNNCPQHWNYNALVGNQICWITMASLQDYLILEVNLWL